ncbi:MAG: NAD-dependent deacetylase [Anaerolineales bacterium]|nr:NAD-dependent deacetylase [Anaerolineales bacterium]
MGSRAQEKIHRAADIVLNSKRGVVLSGAGISTPSGIPDFRSPSSGLWYQFEALEVASLNAFRYNPRKFYAWLQPLAEKIYQAQPNPAHLAIADLEASGHIDTIITQNIDRLHQRAGSRQVLEVHGSLETLTCTHCFKKGDSAPYIEPYLHSGVVPLCASCGHVLKPDVILFGEQLPHRAWQLAQQASKRCDLMLVVGSSLEVLPVAGLPMRALEHGAHLIIINNSETYLDTRADVVFSEDAAAILPLIEEALGGR